MFRRARLPVLKPVMVKSLRKRVHNPISGGTVAMISRYVPVFTQSQLPPNVVSRGFSLANPWSVFNEATRLGHRIFRPLIWRKVPNELAPSSSPEHDQENRRKSRCYYEQNEQQQGSVDTNVDSAHYGECLIACPIRACPCYGLTVAILEHDWSCYVCNAGQRVHAEE